MHFIKGITLPVTTSSKERGILKGSQANTENIGPENEDIFLNHNPQVS